VKKGDLVFDPIELAELGNDDFGIAFVEIGVDELPKILLRHRTLLPLDRGSL